MDVSDDGFRKKKSFQNSMKGNRRLHLSTVLYNGIKFIQNNKNKWFSPSLNNASCYRELAQFEVLSLKHFMTLVIMFLTIYLYFWSKLVGRGWQH